MVQGNLVLQAVAGALYTTQYTGPFLGSAENKSPSGDGVLYALALVLSGGGTVVKSEEVIC